MTIFNSKTMIAALLIAFSFASVPNSASARSSVHVDFHGLTIGVHDSDRRYRKQHKHHKRYYRDRHYYNGSRYGSRSRYNYYYDYYRPRYSSRRYLSGRYYNDRRNNYCPTDTYSSRFYRNRGCYAHGDHYHCDG